MNLDSVIKWIDHNRFTAIALIAAITVALGTTSCVEKTTSPFTGETVSRSTLDDQAIGAQQHLMRQLDQANDVETAAAIEAEARRLNEDLQRAYADLDAKRTAAADAVQSIGAVVSPFAGPWGTLITIGTAGLAAGLFGDNRRKNQVIEVKKREVAEVAREVHSLQARVTTAIEDARTHRAAA